MTADRKKGKYVKITYVKQFIFKYNFTVKYNQIDDLPYY